VAVVLAVAAIGAWWVTRPPSIPNSVPAAARTAARAPIAGAEEKPSPVTAPPAPKPELLTNQSILDLVAANVAPSLIISHIQASETRFDLSTEEIIRLTRAGVPETVLEAMRHPKGVPAPASAARSVAVPDGSAISITLSEDVPAASEPGRQLHFAVNRDFQVGKKTVIANGAPVTGEIVDAAKRRFLRGAKATFRLIQVKSVDGSWLKVRATPQARGGNSARTLDARTRPSSKDIAVQGGTEFAAYIDGDQTVALRR
jgi:hypothetical protein